MDFSKIEEGYPEGEKPLHFYYNREERIKNAPKNVQDYYNGKGFVFSRNVFKVMFSNRFNRMMFIFLLLFCAFAYFMNYQQSRNSARIGGTYASVTAFSYSEEIYATLKFEKLSEKERKSYSGAGVNCILKAVDSTGTVVQEENFSELYDGEELFIRTRFRDYDIIRVAAEVTMGEESKSFSSVVVKR